MRESSMSGASIRVASMRPIARCAALLLALCASVAVAAPPPLACARSQSLSLPAPDACLARLLPPAARGAGAAEEALYAVFAEHMGRDDIVGAEAVLACAEAQLSTGPGLGEDAARAHYALVRRRGVLAYKRERIVEALGHFECGLRIADEVLGDRTETARQLKNLGSGLRRIGDYAGAMRALTRSLRLQEAAGDTALGPVLNNIGDVYRDLEQRQQAERYYQRALETFRRDGNAVEAMHVYDSLSQMALDRREVETATRLLETALSDLRAASGEDTRRYQLRVYSGLARAALVGGDVARARRYCADGLALAAAHGLVVPAELALETARAERLDGDSAAAVARLRGVLAQPPDGSAPRAALMQELALALEAAGRSDEALPLLREAHALAQDDLRAQRDRGLAWASARFDAIELERQLAASEAETRRRTLLLWLTAVSAVAALSLLSVFFLRRQQRARVAEAARRARYEEALAHYRREADALAEDRQLLQTLLDSREDALCLLNADGQLLTTNRAAGALLGAEPGSLAGQALAERFVADDAQALRAALEDMEDAALRRLRLTLATAPVDADAAASLLAELRQWEGGDGLVTVALRPASVGAAANAVANAVVNAVDVALADAGPDAFTAMPALAATPIVAAREDAAVVSMSADAAASAQTAAGAAVQETAGEAAAAAGSAEAGADEESTADDANAADPRQAFRRALVELMLAVVDAWERSTGHNRIELAERSRIWRVNIDDGRLRARAMERYLALSKLPQNPRWRDVLRSAYFVLGQCERMSVDAREDLQRRVDAVLAYTRRNALV